MFIAVIGGNRCSETQAAIAEEVGRELALRGVTLVCGGLGGVMQASCKGVISAGGTTIGILPGDDAADANEYVSIQIVTGLGYARNSIVVKSARAVIAIDGEYGTLSEIAYAMQYGVPVVGLDTWSLSKQGKSVQDITLATDAKDAVDKAIELAVKRGI